MSQPTVTVLTPAGTGAIAVLEVVGPAAWDVARSIVHCRKPLPAIPTPDRFWFGRLADPAHGDEVILAARPHGTGLLVEVHCHGGRRVVRWAVEQFVQAGCVETTWDDRASLAVRELTRASTVRTAAILLDQLHGALSRELDALLSNVETGRIAEASQALAQLIPRVPLGRRLTVGWRVVVAGPPNVGKSSLVNALAGFNRSIVAPTAGTTRDVVTVSLAFDGWPVELTDTAGLRRGEESIEAAGVERAREIVREADLVLRVIDSTETKRVWPSDLDPGWDEMLEGKPLLLVLNKVDHPAGWDLGLCPSGIRVSALTGEGVAALGKSIARSLVPEAPAQGAGVPFTERLCDLAIGASEALRREDVPAAMRLICEARDLSRSPNAPPPPGRRFPPSSAAP